MAIISCPSCGSSISSEAVKCPSCNNQVLRHRVSSRASPTDGMSTSDVPPVNIPSVGDWIVILLLLSIPLVNLIVLLVWAFDNSTNTIKANFAKAALIWVGIFLVLYLLLIVVLIGSYVP